MDNFQLKFYSLKLWVYLLEYNGPLWFWFVAGIQSFKLIKPEKHCEIKVLIHQVVVYFTMTYQATHGPHRFTAILAHSIQFNLVFKSLFKSILETFLGNFKLLWIKLDFYYLHLNVYKDILYMKFNISFHSNFQILNKYKVTRVTQNFLFV